MSKKNSKQPNHFVLRGIKPLTDNQARTFRSFAEGKNLILHGLAGTGKTFISIYLALNEILNRSTYQKIIIVRSAVPTRDVGFLPGGLKEKSKVYEDPYKIICDDLFGRGDGYEILRNKHLIEFTTTSFLRGVTFDNAIVLIDEAQNLSHHEINTIMTRIGENCRVLICGDFRQSDLEKSEKENILTWMKITTKMECFDKIEFGIDDIVRSGFVKSYIIAKLELGYV